MMESWIPSKMAAMVRGGGGAAAGSRRKSTAWKFLSGESKRRASTASGREKKRNTLQVNQKLAPVFLLIQEQIFLRYQTRWMGKLIATLPLLFAAFAGQSGGNWKTPAASRMCNDHAEDFPGGSAKAYCFPCSDSWKLFVFVFLIFTDLLEMFTINGALIRSSGRQWLGWLRTVQLIFRERFVRALLLLQGIGWDII
jgi:hypothetical protein